MISLAGAIVAASTSPTSSKPPAASTSPTSSKPPAASASPTSSKPVAASGFPHSPTTTVSPGPSATRSKVATVSPKPVVSKAPPGSAECGLVDDGKGGVLRLTCPDNKCCSQYGASESVARIAVVFVMRRRWQCSGLFVVTVKPAVRPGELRYQVLTSIRLRAESRGGGSESFEVDPSSNPFCRMVWSYRGPLLHYRQVPSR